jgi:hypothetical protein
VHEIWAGEIDVASTFADQAQTYARSSGDQWAIAMAAWAEAFTEGNAADRRECVERAATLLKQAGNVFHSADVYWIAGYRALHGGFDREALEFYEQAMPLVRELDSPYLEMLARGSFGLAAVLRGDTEAARHAFREQLEVSQQLSVLPTAFKAVLGLAAVAAACDDLDRAARLAGAAAAHRYDQPFDAVETRVDAAFFQPARRRYGPDAWDAAHREGAALEVNDAIAYALDESRPQIRDAATNKPLPARQGQ